MRIVTEYDSTAHEWGKPEEKAEHLLKEAGLEITAFDAGTVLMTGERDVQIGVEGRLEVLADVLDRLNVEGIVWLLEVED